MNTRLFSLSFVALSFSLVACQAPEQPPAEPAVRAEPAAESFPAPVSVPAGAQPAVQVEPIERFRQRFAELGPDLLVIRARITGAQTAQRTLPSPLNWGPGPHVVTTLTLTVTDTVCGPPSDEVRVSYVGGRLEDGTVERTEFMPTDLAMESEHVFVLRAIDGVYYLELGRADLLTLDPAGGFVDAARNRIDVDQLRGLCP